MPAWPKEALVAQVRAYGGDPTSSLNEAVVEVSGYHPDFGYFEAYDIDTQHEVVLATAAELEPLNEHTRTYLANCVEAGVEMYEDEVYELRDALDTMGIAVTAKTCDEWDHTQRRNIWGWINAIATGTAADKPRELKP